LHLGSRVDRIMDCHLFLCLLASLAVAWGWGDEGHRVVAQVAADMLTPKAEAAVNKMLPTTSMANIASVPDKYRTYAQGAWSSPCHYADLPRNANGFKMSYCPNYCVVKSIQNYTSILQAGKSSVKACALGAGIEPCALIFLVHYIGDVHQPLHVGYEDDKGGNDVDVTWFGKSTNLHSVWDSAILGQWNPDWQSATAALEDMIANDPSLVTKYIKSMDPITWADESHAEVKTGVVYDFTGSTLGQTYYNEAIPVVQQRLIAAGVRLGQLLNNIYK